MVNSSLITAVLSNMHPKYRTDKRDTGLQAKVKTTETFRETDGIFPWLFHLCTFNFHNFFAEITAFCTARGHGSISDNEINFNHLSLITVSKDEDASAYTQILSSVLLQTTETSLCACSLCSYMKVTITKSLLVLTTTKKFSSKSSVK